ncbi:MAG TPA: hypothetical protein VLT79_09930 [Gemmatimonadales bacterium]|nr:hypothetical protein [Gemmatimonadales bacterium]
MSSKIVFNGQEYPSVAAMPADVRKQYDDVMRLLQDSGQVPDLAGGGRTLGKVLNILKSTQVRVRVNGKDYGPDELPPPLKALYDRAIGVKQDSSEPVVTASLVTRRAERKSISRELIFFILAGVFLALWFLFRR